MLIKFKYFFTNSTFITTINICYSLDEVLAHLIYCDELDEGSFCPAESELVCKRSNIFKRNACFMKSYSGEHFSFK